MKYKYQILNYWNDQDDLYVNYEIENMDTLEKANVIEYYNVSDIGCDYNTSSSDVIESCLLKLLKQNNGLEFNLPKVSKLSPLLRYLYDSVCESESNMCHIDYNDWEELKSDYDFLEEDINLLKSEIEKYDIADYITVADGEYKICCYGNLQCCFNDDRERHDDFER